jgi:hypothetical protein
VKGEPRLAQRKCCHCLSHFHVPYDHMRALHLTIQAEVSTTILLYRSKNKARREQINLPKVLTRKHQNTDHWGI